MIFLGFALLSVVGKAMKNRQGQQGEGPKPTWPGPVMKPGDTPWPQRREPQAPPPWPQPQAPQPRPQAQPKPQAARRTRGEGESMEGRRSEGFGSLQEGRRTEGISAMVTGTMEEDRARFQGQSEQFRRSRPTTELHSPMAVEGPEEQDQAHPLLQMLASKEGLGQAVLLSEVLGKPRAMRPFGKR